MSNGKKIADSKVHWLSDKSGCQSINVHHKPWSHNNSSFNYFSCSIYRNLLENSMENMHNDVGVQRVNYGLSKYHNTIDDFCASKILYLSFVTSLLHILL